MSMLGLQHNLPPDSFFEDDQAQVFKDILTDLEESDFSDAPDDLEPPYIKEDPSFDVAEPLYIYDNNEDHSSAVDGSKLTSLSPDKMMEDSHDAQLQYSAEISAFDRLTAGDISSTAYDDRELNDIIKTNDVNQTNGIDINIPVKPMNGLQIPLKRKRGRPRKSDASGISQQPPQLQKAPRKISTASKIGLPSPAITSEDTEFRVRSSIPQDLSWPQFARQGIVAAGGARLNPYALHPAEYEMLRAHINKTQATIYLNIRNAICRLWHRNPLIAVTKQEAVGCARTSRHFQLAQVAFDWLVRNGYINFGCLDLGGENHSNTNKKAKAGSRQKTIVVIGAGVSGLSCARQLEGLKHQLSDQFIARGEELPRIVVLEGRNRVGGRVYSHQFKRQVPGSLPGGLRNTAEMGAMIITGFNHGNPLHYIIRGQLGLRYHTIKDATVLYDVDGSKVEPDHDEKVQLLWNDILDRACIYKSKALRAQTAMGDETMIRSGQDPQEHWRVGGEMLDAEDDPKELISEANPLLADTATTFHSMTGREKAAGRAYVTGNTADKGPAAQFAKDLGYSLHMGISPQHSINLDAAATASEYPTLGDVMEEGFRQYDGMIALTPKELRMLNWHSANLEYGFAASLGDLSLSNFDQDGGNEFEGPHSEIIGGYSQLPRGLWKLPYPLDVHFKRAVRAIRRPALGPTTGKTRVECTDESVIEADQVVVTAPLGVLKRGSIEFDPPLPEWKSSCIGRMGFGLLNKIVLVYDTPFWENNRDGWGSLNIPSHHQDEQTGYSIARGQFYYFWNITKTSGRPALVAISVGPSAEAAENIPDHELIEAVTRRLRRQFPDKDVPHPSETIISRWRKDPFAGGSYSYVGARTKQDDYETMAKPVDNIHFSGEGTCGGYPATVHGAYLSGLRAASDVMTALLGPIDIPTPLIPRKQSATKPEGEPVVKRNKPGYIDVWEPILPPQPTQPILSEQDLEAEVYEARIISTILEELGPCPQKPAKEDGVVTNPFLLFTNDNWAIVKQQCNEAKAQSSGNPAATASRHEVRIAIGKVWRDASEDVKKPYHDRGEAAKKAKADFVVRAKAWDAEALRIRKKFIVENPPPEHLKGRVSGDGGQLHRKSR